MADISSVSLDMFLENINGTVNSSVPEICPQCNNKLEWFMLNFEEKILMCKNDECSFPLDCEQSIVVGAINTTEEPAKPTLPTKRPTTCYTSDNNPPINVHTYLNSTNVKIVKKLPGKTRLEKCLETSAMVTNIMCARKKKNTDVTDPVLLKKLYHLQKLTKKTILTASEMENLSKEEESNIDFEIQAPSGSEQLYKIDFSNSKDQLQLM